MPSLKRMSLFHNSLSLTQNQHLKISVVLSRADAKNPSRDENVTKTGAAHSKDCGAGVTRCGTEVFYLGVRIGCALQNLPALQPVDSKLATRVEPYAFTDLTPHVASAHFAIPKLRRYARKKKKRVFAVGVFIFYTHSQISNYPILRARKKIETYRT